jgi:hypothetical protein
MTQRKISTLTRVGLVALVIGLLVRLFSHTSYSEFTAGFLIGLSLVLMIGGMVKRRGQVGKTP